MTARKAASPRIFDDIHRPVPAHYRVREEGTDIIVSCQYWEARHCRNHGGNISSVIFPNGSGKNIFAAPFATQMQKGRPWQEPLFDNSCDTLPEVSCRQEADTIRIESRSRLLDEHGKVFPAVCHHAFTYHPWGLVRQKVTIDLLEPIPDAWKLVIARPVVAPHLDEFTYRPSWEVATNWSLVCGTMPWIKLEQGQTVLDACAAEAGDIPLYLIFLQRGVEGFDWCCGENLDQWHKQISDRQHIGKFGVGHNPALGGYEVYLYPLDMWNSSLAMQGRYEFDFFMGLPFVQERVRPLFRGGGVMNQYGLVPGNTPSSRPTFISPGKIAELGSHHAQIVRLHNDGPEPDGIFWRDGSYPPYPPEILKAMDACIADLHAQGGRSTPYFSLHELHPETPGFEKMAETCKRTVNDEGQILYNHCQSGIWGAQMCLLSDWCEILKQNMDTVLKHHAFDGFYFDWTTPLPCLNKVHRDYAHWDIEGYIEVLEWARRRVGDEGMLYLHMSLVPFIMAENLANCVLVYESPGPAQPTRDMFPPHVEFMKTCSHFALGKVHLRKNPRQYMLHALLNHVTLDAPTPDFLAAYDTLAQIDFTKYRRFANQFASPVTVSAKDVLSAVYWNEKEALVLFGNLSESKATFRWKLDTERIGWQQDKFRVSGKRAGELAPLDFQYVRIVRRKALRTEIQ